MSNQIKKLSAFVLALALACASAMAATTATVTVGIDPVAGGAVKVGGTDVATGTSIDIPTGASKTLRATASEGYKFVMWKVTAGDDLDTTISAQSSSSTDIGVGSDDKVADPAKQAVTIAAVFAPCPVSLTLGGTPTSGVMYPVTAVISGSFYVAGDVTASVMSGQPILISGSAADGNNIYYTVSRTLYDVTQAIGTIIVADTTAHTFTVAGDKTKYLPIGNHLQVIGVNSGVYHVTSATASGTPATTVITVLETVKSATAGGSITAGRTRLWAGSIANTTVQDGTVNLLMGYPKFNNGNAEVKYPGTFPLYGGGATFPATAVALPGYEFTGWTVAGGATIDCAKAKNANVTLASSGTLTPSFAVKPVKTLSVALTPVTANRLPIKSVGGGNFNFAGEVAAKFPGGTRFEIQGSSGNDGVYQVWYAGESQSDVGWVTAATATTFTVAGDKTSEFPAGSTFVVTYSDSGKNDGRYNVASAVLAAGSTVVTITGTVPDVTAGGEIYTYYTYVRVEETIHTSEANGAAVLYDAGSVFYSYKGEDEITGTVPVGEWVALDAAAKLGWRFKSWAVTSGDALLSDPSAGLAPNQ